MADAPVMVVIPSDVELTRISYLEVLDRANRTLVTAIELLSPSNKSNAQDREQHLRK